MPKQILPNEAGFRWLAGELKALGFRPISSLEFAKNFRRMNLRAPRPRFGREAGFTLTVNSLAIRVWTTWLEAEGRAREIDAGWVLIAENDKALYFNHSRRRTKNFLTNLLQEAGLARARAFNRPLCPECQQFMDIVQGRPLKSRYWRCDRLALHGDHKRRTCDWDYGLTKEEKRYARAVRRQRAKYRKKRRKLGKTPFSALLKRKPWMQTIVR